MISEEIRNEFFERIKQCKTDFDAIDYIMEFCEKYQQFCEVFIACKFSPLAFYGYIKANGDLEKLSKAVDVVNKIHKKQEDK